MTTTLTAELLQQLMNCPADRAAECFPAMAQAMASFHIDTPARITCFLTQIRWESGGLVYFAELASGDAYEGRADLGNTQPGDGPRFKGSGPIQVTGRSNFTAAQQALDTAGININILTNPDLARTVQYGFWISCWWWEANGGNQVAERSPLSYASLCCGRLVNRGDANSQYQAQDEAQRIDAFQNVQQFGDLALPGSLPATGLGNIQPGASGHTNPPMISTVGVEDMPISDADAQKIAQAVVAQKINVGWPGQKPFQASISYLIGNTYMQGTSTWQRIAALVAGLSGKKK